MSESGPVAVSDYSSPPEPGQKRVSIVTPAGDHVHTQFAVSLTQMLQMSHTTPHEKLEAFAFQCYGTTVLPFSRYQLAKKSLDVGATHLLWIDSDMSFPADMLLRFCDRDEDIIGINAVSRRPPFRNCAQTAPATPMYTGAASTGLEKAYRLGFGVLWMSVDVLRHLEPPYFNFTYKQELDVFQGEDHYFCMKAKEAGFDLWVDQDLSKQVQHWGSFGFTPLMHDLVEDKT